MIYSVIVDVSTSEIDRVFDYESDFEIEVGSRVKVPFGKKEIEGFIIGEKESTDVKTKKIISKLDNFTALIPEAIELAKYLKETCNIRYVDTLRLCIPNKIRGGRVQELKRNYIKLLVDRNLALDLISHRAEKQVKLINMIPDSGDFEKNLAAEFGQATINALVEKGILSKEKVEVKRMPLKNLVAPKKDISLTDSQKKAINKIKTTTKTILIHGVTGSGKTEIYMNVIENVLNEGKTAIMLVPEISLTPQTMAVFRNRFGDQVALLHSGLGDGERFDEWRRLLLGEARIAIGPRSAIFAPLKNIGVIVIDEEHDQSYVSESNPRYHTHDIAEFRKQFNNAKLVLGSATPAMETYYKAMKGEYDIVSLPNRVNEQGMPEMKIVDMCAELSSGNSSIFSRTLLRSIEETLDAKNQAMIYINRRGYHSFVRCRKCGYVAKCTDCDITLKYHKEDNMLHCHYCGKRFKMLTECPDCHNEKLMKGFVGTEKVVEELNSIYPEARILRLDTDTTGTKDAAAQILSKFSNGEADILVGTQMIVKGHDFSNVTLVGIVDADMGLYSGEYQATERMFQQLLQVSGRAGRADKKGKVIIQSHHPMSYVFRYILTNDYKSFFQKELAVRETTFFPPYTTIAKIIVMSKDEDKARNAARALFEELSRLKHENEEAFIKLKGMVAPISRLKNNYRYQLVCWLFPKKQADILKNIYVIAANHIDGYVSTFVEINPNSMV